MSQPHPIHDLLDRLEKERLAAINALAGEAPGPLEKSNDALKWIGALQGALTAVREEIAAHAVKEGGGAETPLK